VAAAPVSLAARLTPSILVAVSPVPCAACCTLVAISRVAALCCSTADAIDVEISLIRRIVSPILRIASTVCPVAP
jgi:hypothetical protein